MYDDAYRRAVRLLGTERTFTSQLERAGRQLLGHQFGGVNARDTLPPVLQSGRRGYVVNTDCLVDAQGGQPCGVGVHYGPLKCELVRHRGEKKVQFGMVGFP